MRSGFSLLQFCARLTPPWPTYRSAYSSQVDGSKSLLGFFLLLGHPVAPVGSRREAGVVAAVTPFLTKSYLL